MYGTKSIRGSSSLTIKVTNDDVNQSYNTVTANTLTSSGAVFANTTVNLLDLINTKQDAVDGTTDLTVKDLTSNSITNATTLTTASLSATGNISSSAGILSAPNVSIDTNLVSTDSTNNRVAFGVNASGIANGFRVDELFLNKVDGLIDETGICMGEFGTDEHGVLLVTDNTGGNKKPFYGFANKATQNNTARIEYDTDNDRLNFFTGENMNNHKLSIRALVNDFEQQVRCNNGLLLQTAGTLTVSSGGDIVNSSGNIRATTGNVYSETGMIGCGKIPTLAPLDVNGNAEISGTVNCDTLTCSKLTIDTDVLHVDSVNDRVGINTTFPESSLHVVGERLNTPTAVGVHAGYINTGDYGLEICSTTSNESSIDFTVPNEDLRGRIRYDQSGQTFYISANNATQMTINDTTINCQNNLIYTTGNLECNDITATGTLEVNGATLSENQFSSALTTLDLMTSDSSDYTTRIIKTSQGNGLGFELQSQGMSVINATEDISLQADVYCSQDLIVDTDTLFVDASADCVCIGGTNTSSALSIYGTTHDATPNYAGIHMALQAGNTPLIELCANTATHDSHIDFTVPNEDLRGRISYDNSGQQMKFLANSLEQMTISDTQINCKDNDIVSTGTCTFGEANIQLQLIGGGNTTGDNSLKIRPGFKEAVATDNYVTLDIPNEGTLYVWDNLEVANNFTCNGALQAVGTIASSYNTHGVYCGVQGDNGAIEIVSTDTSDHSIIDFAVENNDHKGRIHYNHGSNLFNFVVDNTTQLELKTTEADFQDNDITTTGDLTIATDLLKCDVSADFVGINTTTQHGSEKLNVNGEICCTGLCVSGTSGVISDRQFTSGATFLDLLVSGASDYTHRFFEETSLGNGIGGTFSTQGVTGIDATQWIELKKDVVISSGKTLDANLNSTRGQLLYIQGEENASLNVGSYDFNYGNGANSDSTFGMLVPNFSFKLKRFCYAGNNGTTPIPSTVYVFQLHVNGSAQNVYARCDFSSGTNASKTYHRYSGKFSSSSSSQVDIEPTITTYTYGTNLSWKTIIITNGSTDNRHRFSVVLETTENL